jgi:uncharacterized protein (TIGR02246 family)
MTTRELWAGSLGGSRRTNVLNASGLQQGLAAVALVLSSVSPVAADEAGRSIPQGPIPVVVPSLREFSQQRQAANPQTETIEFPVAPPSRLAVPAAVPIHKPVPVSGDENVAGSTADLEAELVAAEVRGMLLEYLRAFQSRDAAAVAACWSESADNRSLDSGEETHGRDQVEQVFQTLFEEDASAEIDLDIQEIRPLGGDVAVVDGISQLSFSTGDATASRFSAIVMKKDGRWMLESVREAATELPETSRGFAIRRVGEFAGRWESVTGRQDVSTHAFWTAGGGFLVRSHTMQAETGDREITEIIGWDPVRQGIRSWSFTSDGGFAEGSWTLDNDHFDVLLDGTTAAGDIVSGRLTVTRLGPDDLRVEMEGSAIAELLPPAGDMVRTAR